MLSKMAGLTESNRELWQLLAGTSTRFPLEVIREKIDVNKDKVLSGLGYYKKPRANGCDALQKERGLSGDQLELIVKAAITLGLDEVQTFDLYCMYTSMDRRVTVKQLKECIGTEKGRQWLIGRLKDFYTTERLYLLRVVNHLLCSTASGKQPSSLYKDVFSEFVQSLYKSEEFISKYIDQYIKNQDEAKTASCNGSGSSTGLREQCELLELIIIYYKSSKPSSTDALWRLIDKFKAEGFGQHSGAGQRSIQDGNVTDHLVTRSGFLQILLLVQLLQLQGYLSDEAAGLAAEPSGSSSSKIQQQWQQLLTLVQSSLKEDRAEHTVLLLSMGAVYQCIATASSGDAGSDSRSMDARKCLIRSQRSGLFEYLNTCLETEPFCGKTALAMSCRQIIYDLLCVILDRFDLDVFLDLQGCYKLTATLLKYEEIAEEFWLTGLNERLGLIIQSSVSDFPHSFAPSINIFTSVASASQASAQQMAVSLRGFGQYTEYLDNSCSLSATPQPHTFRLNADRRPYYYTNSSVYSGRRGSGFVIRAGTVGEIIEDENEQQQQRGRQQQQLIMVGAHNNSRVGLVQWAMDYDAWDVLVELVYMPLMQILHGAGAVENDSVYRSALSCRLVAAVLHSAGAVWCRDNIIQIGYFVAPLLQTLHRFSSLSQPPTALLSACIDVLTQFLPLDHTQIHQDLIQTSFLPSVSLSNYSDDISQLTRTLQGCSFGQILAAVECVTGHYSLTIAYLNYTLALIDNIVRDEELDSVLPLVMFITQQIYPAWLSWRYSEKNSMETIGQKCMTIFLKLLVGLTAADTSHTTDTANPAIATKKSRSLTRRVLIQQLQYTGCSATMLKLIATGVDRIEATLANQDCVVEGQGVELVNLVVMAMTLLNTLLAASPAAAAASSPIAQLLTAAGQQGGFTAADWARGGVASDIWVRGGGADKIHPLATLTQYIYHRHEPKLPGQATLLLKNISALCPMLVLACLDKAAEPIRDTYLSRLAAVTEDVSLKVEILDWLSTCVQTQPGVLELFLNIPISSSGSQPTGQTGTQMSSSKTGCLQVVMSLLSSGNQDTYECPTELNCALLQLIHTLWEGKRLQAITVLTNRKEFWPAVFRSLYKNLDLSDIDIVSTSTEGRAVLKKMSSDVCSVALALRTIALELYDTSNSISDSLQKELASLISAKRLIYWSQYIKDLLQWTAGLDTEVLRGDVSSRDLANFPLRVLLAWRDILTILSTNQLPISKMDKIRLDDAVKNQILCDILSASLAQYEPSDQTSVCTQMTSALLNTYLILLRNFNPKCVANGNAALSQLMIVIGQARLAVDSGSASMSALTAALGGASLLVLINRKPALSLSGGNAVLANITRKSQTNLDSDLLCRQCLPIVCETVQMCTKLFAYIPSSASTSGQPATLSGSKSTLANKKQKLLKVLSVATSLLSELMTELLVTASGSETSPISVVLDILRSFSLIPCLLTTLSTLLQTDETESDALKSILNLFLVLAQTPQGSETLYMNSVCRQLCVLVTQLYVPPSSSMTDSSSTAARGGAICQMNDPPGSTRDQCSAYRLYITFMASMLKSLGAEFVHDVLDFVGVHEQRIRECFNAVIIGRMNKLSDSLLDEVLQTCILISTLSHHERLWKLHQRNTLNAIMTHMCALLQTCSAILNRTRLDVRLSTGGKDGAGVRPPKFARTFSSSSGSQQLSSQLSTDESSAAADSLEVQAVQNRLLQIVSHCMTALRRFTAPLLSLITDPMLDLTFYDRFVAINFSQPSLEQQEPVLSFGTFISLFNFGVRTLSKIDASRSTTATPQKPTASISAAVSSDDGGLISRKLVIYVMENAVHLMLSHSMLHLRDNYQPARDKQLLKRELASELNACSTALQRHLKCLSSNSSNPFTPSPGITPGSTPLGTPLQLLPAAAISSGRRSMGGTAAAGSGSCGSGSAAALFSQEWAFFRVMDVFINQIYK